MHIHTLSQMHILIFTVLHTLMDSLIHIVYSLYVSLSYLLTYSAPHALSLLIHTHTVSHSLPLSFTLTHTHKHTDILVLKYDLSIKSKHISDQMRENLKFYILEFINLPWQIKSDERDSLYPFGFGWKSPGMLLT